MTSAASHSDLSLHLVDSQPDAHVQFPAGPRGPLWPAYQLIFRPIEALAAWREEFGPTFTVNRLGSQIVFTGDPELIQRIYAVSDTDGLFVAAVPETIDILLGKRSVLMSAGVQHQRERKLMMPPFHGERMRMWATEMAEAGRRAFAQPGETTALARAQQATLDVIIRVIFGVGEPERMAAFSEAVLTMMEALRPGFLFSRTLQHEMFGLSNFAKFKAASDHLDALLDLQIAETRANLDARSDVLADLLRARYDDGSSMDDDAIRDQLRTLLVAGHETTATILAWAIYFVLRDDEVRTRVREELDALGPDAGPEQLARLPYLGAVIDETLRIRPISPDTVRVLSRTWQLGEYTLPAGTAIAPSPLLVHFDEALWPEPHAFRPQRFLDGRPRPNVYLPFGGGTRRCLGATFARFEACVLLATCLRELDIELLDAEVEWVRGPAALQPKCGVRIRVNG